MRNLVTFATVLHATILLMDNDFCIENSMGFLVGRAARVMAQTLNRNFLEAGYELTVDHWIILSKLLYEGGQKQQHFTEVTGRDKTSITRIIDYMEERKWVYRAPDKHDRRVNSVYLTNQGQGLQADLRKIVEKTNRELESHLDEKDLKTCKKVLNEIFELLYP